MGATQSIQKPCILKTETRGSLEGIEQSDTKSGKAVCYRFTRIPYALPPTGDRRWKRPERLASDFSFNGPAGGSGDYTQFGNLCPQPVYDHGSAMVENSDAAPEPTKNFDEDCLYLNIWVPAGPPPEEGWPVQFYIHGGWLQVGDAAQTSHHDPFDLLKDYPRIIVAPTYRLNLFGFLSGSELASESADIYQPGNYGFWDQRLALEFVHANIHLFGGNRNNISVGGLSAGAYSTVFQLYYDTYRQDPADRLIKRIFLFSNSVGVQPKPTSSPEIQAQFDELLAAFEIPETLSASEKLHRLRAVPAELLANKINSLKLHTFRATTDGEFIPSTFLSSIHDGSFADLLRQHNVKIMLGEVSDEAMLYRYVHPASSYSTMVNGLQNYYPTAVTNALLKVYPIPGESAPSTEWRDIFASIVADCQVHAVVRGFSSTLLIPKPGRQALPIDHVFRYRISWRAKGLDAWLSPDVGVCHAADIPIWWQSGRRGGFDAGDIEKCKVWLKPFMQFLAGEEVEWGTRSATEIREFSRDGMVRIVEDEGWQRGLQVWDTMWKAQS